MRRAWMVGASALVLAGCAGTAGTSSSPGAATGSAAPGAADMSAYVQCLSEHGVELPTAGPMSGTRPEGAPSGRPTDMPTAMPTDLPSAMPGGGPEGQPRGQMAAPPGVDDATWQAAQDACSELAPTGRDPQDGTAPPGGTAPPAGDADSHAVFWTCMADHDVTAPASGLPADLDPDDPGVAAALAICDALLPDQVTG